MTYTDPYFWRPASSQDAALNTTSFVYTPTTSESILAFNGNASVSEQLATVDGYGRLQLSQRQRGFGLNSYDSSQTNYDTFGRPNQVTVPYVGTAGQTTSSTPTTTTTYDALNRPTQTTDAGGGYVSYSYNQNDVLQTLGPAPAGENTKRKQLEYDALGRLTSVCELTQGSGYVSCSQTSAQNGYMTTYAYSWNNGYNQVVVTQNAQSASTQTRTYLYDLVGRLVSETNPESGTKTYVYDSTGSSSCSGASYASTGDMVRTADANGTNTCYFYDVIHRLTDVGTSRIATDRCKRFRYDNSSGVLGAKPSGVVTNNSLGRLVEAETDTCAWPITGSSIITDEWSSYSSRGEVTDVWESTLHSSGYYHPTAAYWANGALKTLSISGIPTISYGADGEGRTSTVSASTGQNPVTATSYNTASQVTGVTFGSGDSDAFALDPNTGRMTQYKFNVNGSSEVANLTWNANANLTQLAINDPFNAANTQTCNYANDDLSRLITANCGTPWSQTFTFDPFGNITQSGTLAWMPGYNSSTNRYALGGSSYDADGNVLNDTFHTYTWDADGKMLSIDSTTMTYDALHRMVERYQSGAYTQIVWSPTGDKLGLFQAQAVQQVYVPLPGGDVAQYVSWGLSQYRHSDWLGTDRLETNTSRAVVDDNAYSPYGMPYSQTGNGEISFTGQNTFAVWPQYDFLYRQFQPQQGRWLSPDPAGLAAVDPSVPQSWNRYAYVENNPLAYIDPDGTTCTADDQSGCGNGAGDGGNVTVDGNGNGNVAMDGISVPGETVNVSAGFIAVDYLSLMGQQLVQAFAQQFTFSGFVFRVSVSGKRGAGNNKKNCATVPTHPGYGNVNANMDASKAAPFAIYSFYNLVRNHGPWDYKQAKSLNDFGQMAPHSPFEDFGNFNYGATAASLGLPLSVALRGAGYAGVKSATGSTWDAIEAALGSSPYGDDSQDQVQISNGYNFSKQGCRE